MSIDILLPSPIVKLEADLGGVDLFVKREDLIHPEYGGNKWRKLKYNLEAFREGGYTELVTFGGAFSNHIAATAGVCQSEGFPCVGLIRGNYVDAANPTLNKAREQGMKLFHISKDAYRLKEQAPEVREILSQFRKPLLVPEGGSNTLALRGVGELMAEVHSAERSYDEVIVAAGTGTTAAGIISHALQEKVTVINVLKNESLTDTIQSKLLQEYRQWEVNSNYHFDGFAKTTDELIAFINAFYADHNIPLDPVYNGKAMYGTLDMIRQGHFSSGSNILYIHTGGLQGITAYNYRSRGKRSEILF